MLMNFNKLKEQKGLTGIDVVIAITIIFVTTVAIVTIYVNIVTGSKKATRNSAATRLGTSILENISSMYYAEVEQELYRVFRDEVANVDNDWSAGMTLQNCVLFNTNIDPGYTVFLQADELTNSTDKGRYEVNGALWDCPLIIEIKLKVTYSVSDNFQEISLRTVKSRELLNEYNAPNIEDLLGMEYKKGSTTTKIKTLNKIQPIKWSMDKECYVRANETDDDWYNYRSREWAKVVITNDKSLFKSSTGGIDKSNLINQVIYMWIPRYGIDFDGSIAYTYGKSNDKISKLNMKVNKSSSVPNGRDFFFYGVALFDVAKREITDKKIINVDQNIFPEGKSGIWIQIGDGADKASTEILTYLNHTLTNSIYGPAVSHYGKDFY